ncbi:MAG: hypothetical protein QNJ14_01230 [Woeseiaceae bacterium]|nr:hypothetical protein [Woeseiaceae bacterium]
MSSIQEQEKLVHWGYAIQWCTLLWPPAIIASVVYLFWIRKRILNRDIRTHVSWQLVTASVTIMAIPVAIGLLFVGLSGVNTDSAVSIVATFALIGGSYLFLPWLAYRLLRGSLRFSNELPMEHAWL